MLGYDKVPHAVHKLADVSLYSLVIRILGLLRAQNKVFNCAVLCRACGRQQTVDVAGDVLAAQADRQAVLKRISVKREGIGAAWAAWCAPLS